MSHNVETMAYAGTKPWHHLGTALEGNVTALEMLAAAKLDWDVYLEKMWVNSRGVAEGPIQVPGMRAVRRDSDHSILGIVSKKYTPIQNTEIAEVAQVIAGEGAARCHTAGSLQNGKLVWFLLEFPGEIRVVGDPSPIAKYMCLVSSHDSSQAFQVFPTPVRVVCNNTLNVAVAGMGARITIRHTASATARLKVAQKVVAGAGEYYERFSAMCTMLSGAPFSEEQMKTLAAKLFPSTANKQVSAKAALTETWAPQTGKSLLDQITDGYAPLPGETASRTEDIPAVTQNKRDDLVHLYQSGTGITSGMRGTAWAALNAVAEYTDHHKSVRATNGDTASARAQSLLLGSGADLKAKAMQNIMNMVQLSC